MKSYHELQEQTYKSVREKPFRRMVGKKSWRKWCALRDEAVKMAVSHKVNYDWSQNRGLMALIYGTERMAAEFPDYPPYEDPEPPPNVPVYPDDADEDERRNLRSDLDIQRRDDAVVKGFIKGFGENIQDACEEKLYQDLEHIRFGYDEVWPEQYMREIKRHCPLDVGAIKEAKEHLFRGWARLDRDHPETVRRFGVRLKMEQDSLRIDGVTVSDQDIKEHYLLQVYRSQAFTKQIIRDFKQLEPDDQDWDQATNYFQNAMEDMEELERLMGDTPQAGTIEDINAAMEQNMGEIFEKFDARVEERVEEVVRAALEQNKENVNSSNLTKQVSDLKAEVASLKSSLAAAVKTMKDGGGGGGGGGGSRNRNGGGSPASEGDNTTLPANVSETDADLQYGKNKNKLGWRSDLKLNKDWNYQQKNNYRKLLQNHKPEEYKRQQTEYLKKQIEELGE